MKGPGRQGWGEQGRPGPSPEDVEADVALEVNVGMIDHRLTLHLGGVMRITLAHLAPGKEGRWLGAPAASGWASAVASSAHLKLTLKLNTNFPLL